MNFNSITTASIVCVIHTAIAFFLLTGCGTIEKFKKEEQILSTLQVKRIDLSGKKDGSYAGAYQLPLKSARVRVVIQNGKIMDIELLEHSHGPGHSGEGVIASVLRQQSLQVDAVSGATKSSMAILKAIENALTH